MILTTKDEGKSFKCEFGTYDGDTALDIKMVLLSDVPQDIKDVTITLSDKTDFDVSWM